MPARCATPGFSSTAKLLNWYDVAHVFAFGTNTSFQITDRASHFRGEVKTKVDDMKNRHLLHKPIEPHFPSLNDGDKQQFRDNIRPPKAQ